ncbi:CRISPR-associated endoribonuclease Cas6 [Anaerosporobacter sp.]|uniref:CRISPR-associated endoribonuclease Cas6 n=1 Tax=Anaerosporobacter sp. TaxID=1872529 RepID=UPI00286F8825|nr:CRISPR-associated endoribonuclease Cas6 [Anaerosporobacter sp.]
MKFSLEFSLKENTIQSEYRRVVMHFIKTCLGDVNEGKYYNDFYGEPKSKNFTFAVFFSEPKFIKDEIKLANNQVKVLISIADKMESYILYSSFLEKKHSKVMLEHNNYMILDKVTKLAEQEVHNSSMLVKMNSPLLVRNHDKQENRDWYYDFQQEEFEEQLEKNLRFQLTEEGFSEELMEGLRIQPIKCRKVIVRHYGCKFAGNIGNFLVEGNPIVLNYLLKAGAASRHSEGFGMMELLTDDL